jgi:hypothetical protein
VPGAAHEQDDDRRLGIPRLQRDPPTNCLKVAKAGLALDWKEPGRSLDDSVPRALVAGNSQRNLMAHPEPRGQNLPKTSQQLDLSGVPNRPAVREGPQRQVQRQR